MSPQFNLLDLAALTGDMPAEGLLRGPCAFSL
jgi:hypothetical protein